MTAVRAAVFDMDGTLVDNMRWHVRAWVAQCERRGVPCTPESFEREHAGKKSEEIVPLLVPGATAEEVALFVHEKETLYQELYRPHLEPLPGLMELLARLESARVPLAVATAAPPGNRTLVLDGLDLTRRFATIVGAEDAPRGKPAPDIYLAAARRLGLEPGRCVAFEDAVNGVLAARAAGMRAVGITTGALASELRRAGAQWTIADFRELPEDLAEHLFTREKNTC